MEDRSEQGDRTRLEELREEGWEELEVEDTQTGRWRGEILRENVPVLSVTVDQEGNLRTTIDTTLSEIGARRLGAEFFDLLSEDRSMQAISPNEPVVNGRTGKMTIDSKDHTVSFAYNPSEPQKSSNIEIYYAANRLLGPGGERYEYASPQIERIAFITRRINPEVPIFLVRKVHRSATEALHDF